MLNRRSLRVKVMQNLFALHQSKEANYLLCRDQVEATFTPDLNSMEVQDKKELKQNSAKALTLLEKAFEQPTGEMEDENPAIRKSVKEALHFYTKAVKKDSDYLKKNLVADVEKIYDRYISVLALAIAFAEAAEADKKINHRTFLSNAWVQALRSSAELKKESLRLSVSWQNKTDQVKLWLRDVVKQDAEYMNYLDRKGPPFDEQRKFINHFFRRIILGKTTINDFFEEEVLRWAEDHEIVKGMVEKTIKSYDPESQQPIQLHALSLNWEDDRHFIEKLFTDAAALPQDFQQLIANNTRNWEVERLPLTDRVILEMAIAEMVGFPHIPVKVSINEYIELAKNYSTPKSRQFINGILDVISKALKTSGAMKKSGRGLLDNK
jgi:N utilization substance protein B